MILNKVMTIAEYGGDVESVCVRKYICCECHIS